MTYQRPPETGRALRLHMNENTAGCSPAVLEALASLSVSDIARYPDYGIATERCARLFGVPAAWVQLTNGLDEGLHAISQSRPPGFAAVIVEPAFEMYAISVTAARGRPVTIAPRPGFAFPVEAVLAALEDRPPVLFLTDPNNPTGISLPDGVVDRLAAEAPDTLVVVDEAYADFSARTSLPLLDHHPNLVIGRTFAKGHGLAGLRIGAVVGHPDTLAPIRWALPPFSVNTCAVRALEAALDDAAYVEARVEECRDAKRLVYDFCHARRLEHWASDANFVLVRVGADAPAIVAELAARGIVIRDRSAQPGCDGCVRFTAMVVEHTRRCLSALEAALATRPN
jgi:histidinol-phosphate aminotransferase